MRMSILGSTTALALLSCGGSSNAIYIRAVSSATSAPTGTNCAATNTGTTTTITNEGNLTDAAIYLAPNNQAMLDMSLAGGQLLMGTLTGSTYAFAGKVNDTQTSGGTVIVYEDDISVTLTTNGNAVSGSAAIDQKITCQNGCTGFNNSDCKSSSTFAGSIVPGIQSQTPLTPTP